MQSIQPNDPELTVLIADDHPLFREGIKMVVGRDRRITGLIEAGDGEEALRSIEEKAPTLAILDLDMPGLGGLEVTAAVRKKGLATRLIILTMHDSEEMFNRAIDIGVMGYILKDSVARDITNCISAVLKGEFYMSPSLSPYLLRRSQGVSQVADALGLSLLTQTERRVLKLISEGKTTKEIAAELFSSPKTVENHRANICQKLDVHGTNALFRFAVANQKSL